MPRNPKLETKADAQRLVAEAARRAKQRAKIDFERLSFGPQLDLIRDDSHLIAAVCGRQCGKTEGQALLLLDTAQKHPHCQVLYITLTRPSAKRIMWPKLQAWNRKLQLGAKFNHQDLTMTLPNGSRIELGGANDESEIERYRGVTVPLIVLDEAQAFRPYLQRMVEEILQPALIAMNGRLVMIGTPNSTCTGFFHDATTGAAPGWSLHHWTIYNNPFVPHAGAWLEEHVLKARRITRDDPAFQREWLGRWIRDSSGLVFPVPEFALIDDLPEADDWSFVLGVDVGYVDACAFVTQAYSVERKMVVTVESHQKTELIPTAICVEIDKLGDRYDYESIVIDPGGGGKLVVEELKQRYGVPAKVAEKRAKMAAIENLNGDLRSGGLKIVRDGNEDLLHDLSLLQWDYSKVAKKGGHGGHISKDLVRIDDRTPDHLADANLYAYRECMAYLHEDEELPPTVGSKAWTMAQESALKAAMTKKAAGPQGFWWEQ